MMIHNSKQTNIGIIVLDLQVELLKVVLSMLPPTIGLKPPLLAIFLAVSPTVG